LTQLFKKVDAFRNTVYIELYMQTTDSARTVKMRAAIWTDQQMSITRTTPAPSTATFTWQHARHTLWLTNVSSYRRSKHRESTTRLKLGAHTPLRLQTLTPVSFSHKNTRFTAGNKHTTNAAWRLMKPAMSYVCLWTLTGRRQDGALMSHTLGHTSAPQKWVSHRKQCMYTSKYSYTNDLVETTSWTIA